MRNATYVVETHYATVAQLVWEYDHLPTKEDKQHMLEWAKDPNNPNPNAIDFYNNIKRFG